MQQTDVSRLGEVPYSFGYGGTGKASCNGRFVDYGPPFGVGALISNFKLDIITGDKVSACVDLNAGEIYFKLNGRALGRAFPIDLSEDVDPVCLTGISSQSAKAAVTLFPHILLKNMSCRVRFMAHAAPQAEPDASSAAPQPDSSQTVSQALTPLLRPPEPLFLQVCPFTFEISLQWCHTRMHLLNC